jgi:4-hydroxybenzoate polyprenyltransferase
MYLVGLGIVAIHAYSTIPDYTADRRANEQTFATTYGKRATAGFATALFAFIWIAGSFQSPELRVGLALGTGTFATSTITTDECLAYHLIRTLGAASCIIMTIFIITH